MSNLISFSLWGNNPKYYIGALKNVELAKQFYPNFVCRFYCDILVPRGIKYELEDLGSEIIEMECVGDFKGMQWRFQSINEADIVLIRDADSRISLREKECVDEWTQIDKLFHTMIDHPSHSFHLMPGMSGFKKSNLDMKKLLDNFDVKNHYGIDYLFFQKIYDLIKDDLLIHDSIYGRGKEFLTKRNGLEFVGKIYDENDKTIIEHEKILEQWLILHPNQ